MNLIIFEDNQAGGFYPISVSHPVYDLLYGCLTVYDRLKYYFNPDNVFLSCRIHLANITRNKYNNPVNDFLQLSGDSLFINAALVPNSDIFDKIKSAELDMVLVGENGVLGGKISEGLAKEISFNESFSDPENLPEGIKSKKTDGKLFKHLWEMVNNNPAAIENDISLLPGANEWKRSPQSLKHGDNVYIHPDAKIGNGVFIEDHGGPVIIDEGATVEPRSLIQGPCYIGEKCVIMSGMIREGCSLGPVCKVGGELEESIILGYSNKCHEGFIGHSYLGEWVNLGALTTNSDLKNNYGEIKVSMKWQMTNTHSIKAGCFIGDHTKTGIGTLLNTGIVIGFSNNLYGGGLFMEREIGHFRWGTPGNLVRYRVDKALEVAQAVMNRRGVTFDDDQRALFEWLSRI